MNSAWKAFLESQSASFTETGEASFEVAGGLPETALFDLSHQGLIQVSGEDAENFLQGQFTSDISEVSPVQSQPSAYCSPKGRMLASFRIFMRDASYFLQLPHFTHQSLLKRLPMFVLMSKVEISDASDQLVTIGIAGAQATSLLGEKIAQLPTSVDEVVNEGPLTVIKVAQDPQRYQIIGPESALTDLWQSLAKQATPSHSDHWGLLEIRSGTPTITEQTVDAFVPQMTNLQLINGVSFTKGCYTGQEVVARMKYLGKLKRRMYRARVEMNERPAPGDEVFSPASESAQGAGKVVDARPSPAGGFELLVVAEISAAEKDALHLDAADGPKLQLEPLPYAFEQA